MPSRTRKKIFAKRGKSSGGGGGSVNSVTGTFPIISSGGANPNISINQEYNRTVAQMQALALAGTLIPGQQYLITDADSNRVPLAIRAYDTSILEEQGFGVYQNSVMSSATILTLYYDLTSDTIGRAYDSILNNDISLNIDQYPFDNSSWFNNTFNGCILTSNDTTLVISGCDIKDSTIKNCGTTCIFSDSTINNTIIDVNSHNNFTYTANEQKGNNGVGTPNTADIFITGNTILIKKNNIGLDGYGLITFFDSIGDNSEISGNKIVNSQATFNSLSISYTNNIIYSTNLEFAGTLGVTYYFDSNDSYWSYAEITNSNLFANTLNSSLSIEIINCLDVENNVLNSTHWWRISDVSGTVYYNTSGSDSRTTITACSDYSNNSIGIKCIVVNTGVEINNCTIGDNVILSPTSDLSNIISENTKQITKAALISLAGNYTFGTTYQITDAANSYCPTSQIWVKAIDANTLDLANCVRVMNVPFSYAINAPDSYGNLMKGIYNNVSGSYDVNQVVVWGGRVWQCVFNTSGGDAIDDITLNSDFVLLDQPTFPLDYINLQFGCSYDLANDWVNKQWDDKGNVFGVDYLYDQYNYGFGFNFCDVADWNYETNGNGYPFVNNICDGAWNNISNGFLDNKCTGILNNNVFVGPIAWNQMTAGLTSCTGTGGFKYNNTSWYFNANSFTGNVQDVTGNYLEYKVLLSQSSTSVPTATVLDDNLSASVGGITFGFVGTGTYTATRGDGLHWSDYKTEVVMGSANNGSSTGNNLAQSTWYIPGTSDIEIETFSFLGVARNDALTNTSFTIRIYF